MPEKPSPNAAESVNSPVSPCVNRKPVNAVTCHNSGRSFVPRRSSTGQRMAFLQLEDLTGSCEVVVFARTFEECAAVLRPLYMSYSSGAGL